MNKFEELYIVGSFLRSLKEKDDVQDIKDGLKILIDKYNISFDNLVADLDFLCCYEDINHNKYKTGFSTCDDLYSVACLLENIVDEYYRVHSMLEYLHATYFDGYVAEIYPYGPADYISKEAYINNFENNGTLDYLKDMHRKFIILAESRHHLWYADDKIYALMPLIKNDLVEKVEYTYENNLLNYYICDEEDETCYSNLNEIYKMFIDEIQYVCSSVDNLSVDFPGITFPVYKDVVLEELIAAVNNL